MRIDCAYKPRRAIRLDPKGDSTSVRIIRQEGPNCWKGYYKFQRVGKWVKGMTLDLKQGYFVCWSDQTTYFFEFLKPWKAIKTLNKEIDQERIQN